jgi:hypothetical protein
MNRDTNHGVYCAVGAAVRQLLLVRSAGEAEMSEELRDYEIYLRSGSSMIGTMSKKDADQLHWRLKERENKESFRCAHWFVDANGDEVSINLSQVEAFVHRPAGAAKKIGFGRG